MITFVEGKIAEKQPARVVLDVHGVGYEIFIPLSSYDRLPAIGDSCRVLTHDHVREDAHLLYGFASEAERQMFLLLLGVSGIGPKSALGVLSGLNVKEIKAAVVGGDVKRLSSISGIGKKTAERIIVELKHKIGDADALEAVAGAEELPVEDMKMRDAILAMIALGYKQADARRIVVDALRGKDTGALKVEDIVKQALASGPGRLE